ncbi:MAG: hypothetical protein FWB93_00350 [Oscillospiraceae bacterium]|nr:hypothetical protein [Oscillospiraceae bacterium]
MTENKNSEIYLNLKMPENGDGDSLSMQNMVMTVYKGRKVFFFCCFIGLVFALLFGAMQLLVRPADNGGYIIITMNYPGAENNYLPNGEEFNEQIFFTIGLWRAALDEVGLNNITVPDAINNITITRILPPASDGETEIATPLSFRIEINPDTNIFVRNDSSIAFLDALSNSIQNHINSEYLNNENAGFLYGQRLNEWAAFANELIHLDEHSFQENFRRLYNHLYMIERHLQPLNETSIFFVSDCGNNFTDLIAQIRNFRTEMSLWHWRTSTGMYVRNIDSFRANSSFVIETLQINRDILLERITLYNELLEAFQQNSAEGVIVLDTVEILNTSRELIYEATAIGREIAQHERNIGRLGTVEATMRTDSAAAETVLLESVQRLANYIETVNRIISNYYVQQTQEIVQNSLLSTTPSFTQSAGSINMMRLGIAVLLPLLGGIAVGFFAAVVKGYLPEKPQGNGRGPKNTGNRPSGGSSPKNSVHSGASAEDLPQSTPDSPTV